MKRGWVLLFALAAAGLALGFLLRAQRDAPLHAPIDDASRDALEQVLEEGPEP